VDAANPGLTLAEQFRLLATWRVWEKMRADAMKTDD